MRQTAEQQPTTTVSAGGFERGITFLFSSLSQSFECDTNFKRGLSQSYQYSGPLHDGHVISPGCPSDRLRAMGCVFLLPLNGRRMSLGTDLSEAGN